MEKLSHLYIEGIIKESPLKSTEALYLFMIIFARLQLLFHAQDAWIAKWLLQPLKQTNTIFRYNTPMSFLLNADMDQLTQVVEFLDNWVRDVQ